MRSKAAAPKEDPETAARRAIEEARAEADRTSATQGLLDRRTRRVLRIFGKPIGGGSGSSGIVATPGAVASSGGFRTGGARAGLDSNTTFDIGGRGGFSQFVN